MKSTCTLHLLFVAAIPISTILIAYIGALIYWKKLNILSESTNENIYY